MNRSGDIGKQFLSVLVKTLQKRFVFPKCDPLFLISDRYDMTLANACVALSQRWIKVSGSRILLISLCLEKLIFYTQSESFSSGIYHLLRENAFIMVIVLLPGILHSVYQPFIMESVDLLQLLYVKCSTFFFFSFFSPRHSASFVLRVCNNQTGNVLFETLLLWLDEKHKERYLYVTDYIAIIPLRYTRARMYFSSKLKMHKL